MKTQNNYRDLKDLQSRLREYRIDTKLAKGGGLLVRFGKHYNRDNKTTIFGKYYMLYIRNILGMLGNTQSLRFTLGNSILQHSPQLCYRNFYSTVSGLTKNRNVNFISSLLNKIDLNKHNSNNE